MTELNLPCFLPNACMAEEKCLNTTHLKQEERMTGLKLPCFLPKACMAEEKCRNTTACSIYSYTPHRKQEESMTRLKLSCFYSPKARRKHDGVEGAMLPAQCMHGRREVPKNNCLLHLTARDWLVAAPDPVTHKLLDLWGHLGREGRANINQHSIINLILINIIESCNYSNSSICGEPKKKRKK